MAAVCQVTGATPGFGHNISHSHRRTQRRFDPNIQKKTYFVPSLKRNVTLTLSAKGIKTVDARGIESVVAELLARGEKIYWLKHKTFDPSSSFVPPLVRATPMSPVRTVVTTRTAWFSRSTTP